MFNRKLRLLATVAPFVVVAAPAYAQVNPTAPSQEEQAAGPVVNPQSAQPEDADDTDIVVTGSLLRRTDAETPSPVTTLTAEALDQRGLSTVQDAIQQLTSNNGPALTNSFTANGAFAAGASAVSLRGLSTNSTLVLFDGLRAAYYPLADDGSRNFVDLNTIPDDIIDRIEVLRDGASSSYGADAIAGVVNIITKRQFTGIGGRAEAGITEDGNASNQRLTLTAGIGDIDEQGFNAYVSGFYYRTEAVANRDLPYPFNTDDQRGIEFEGNQGPNNIVNGPNADGGYQGLFVASDFFAIPSTNVGYQQGTQVGGAIIPGARYQKLNPNSACISGSSYTLTDEEFNRRNAAGALTFGTSPRTVCQEDLTNLYAQAFPNIERFGGSARFTAKIGDNSEAYALFNFQQSTVNYTGFPATIRGNAPTGINFPQFSTSAAGATFAPGSGILALPVFVCAARVNCDTAADRRLNPNNPFAAQGQLARILGRIPETTFNETRSKVYRAAAGIRGTIMDDWDYSVEGTAMHNDLRRTSAGYVYIQNLLNVIADGSYNFVNPGQTPQSVLDYLKPTNITDSTSDLYQAQATLAKALYELPGGPLQLAIGGSIRYEAVDAPSANPDAAGPTQRYFTLNAFGTSGNRTVYSAFAELDAPIVDQFTVNASGRYDRYSSGQDAFSPKIGAKFTPIPQLAIRGTYSRGFRIPSFGEANALPTTGYVTVALSTLPQSFLSQYGANCTAANPSGCSAYVTSYSRGLTTLASPNLEPEKSRSFTGGVIFEPLRNVTLTVDYFNIKKTGAITSLSSTPALDAYFAGQPIPAGYAVIPDAPDINNPTALPRPGFVASELVNANTIFSEGIDFAVTGRFNVTDDIVLTTSADASLILELSTSFPDGSKEVYQGTLGNFNLTAGNGTPRWRASWQNTVDLGRFVLTGTANYFDGYDLSAEDQGTRRGDCGLSAGYTPCRVASYTTLDLVGSFKVNDDFTFYVQALNALNHLPAIDPVTYGAHLYNPVQGGTGILGRAFRAGVRFGL